MLDVDEIDLELFHISVRINTCCTLQGDLLGLVLGKYVEGIIKIKCGATKSYNVSPVYAIENKEVIYCVESWIKFQEAFEMLPEADYWAIFKRMTPRKF